MEKVVNSYDLRVNHWAGDLLPDCDQVT
jgi:hypothetical protein